MNEIKKKWLKTKEAEEYSGFCFKTLKKLVEEELIVGEKVRGRWRFDRESIDRLFSGADKKVVTELILHEVLQK